MFISTLTALLDNFDIEHDAVDVHGWAYLSPTLYTKLTQQIAPYTIGLDLTRPDIGRIFGHIFSQYDPDNDVWSVKVPLVVPYYKEYLDSTKIQRSFTVVKKIRDYTYFTHPTIPGGFVAKVDDDLIETEILPHLEALKDVLKDLNPSDPLPTTANIHPYKLAVAKQFKNRHIPNTEMQGIWISTQTDHRSRSRKGSFVAYYFAPTAS